MKIQCGSETITIALKIHQSKALIVRKAKYDLLGLLTKTREQYGVKKFQGTRPVLCLSDQKLYIMNAADILSRSEEYQTSSTPRDSERPAVLLVLGILFIYSAVIGLL